MPDVLVVLAAPLRMAGQRTRREALLFVQVPEFLVVANAACHGGAWVGCDECGTE